MGPELLLVHTMGRVASTAVQRALQEHLERDVFHVHHVNPVVLARQVARAGSMDKAARSVLDGLDAACALIRHSGHVKIISLVRDPIARNISALFADVRRGIGPEQLDEILADTQKISERWARFYDNVPNEWFDIEMLDTFGIDVYSRPFPPQGVGHYSNGRAELLVLRCELDDEAKAAAIAQFVGAEGLRLGRENDGSRRGEFDSRYRRFCAAIDLDADYVAGVASSRYMRHFYAGTTATEYVQQWTGTRGRVAQPLDRLRRHDM